IATVATWLAWPVPVTTLRPTAAATGVRIEDRHGLPLRTTRAADGTAATWVPYDQIDPDVIAAFVAVEDRRFWEHHGVDPRAVARAVGQNVRARRVVSGASTITMQLARLLHPRDRGWTSKVAQALWAVRLDLQLSKRAILEQYLNRVQLGQATAGVAAAALRERLEASRE
ncbi:MAG TPA: biosynthetic peptidoglycan transglycosylase, partial [Candidatus Limnocylindrales bacterium]|nr:biosynthetic peptidoglycan transglycosylase [Candidatus Limnocylindrales bacterium]